MDPQRSCHTVGRTSSSLQDDLAFILFTHSLQVKRDAHGRARSPFQTRKRRMLAGISSVTVPARRHPTMSCQQAAGGVFAFRVYRLPRGSTVHDPSPRGGSEQPNWKEECSLGGLSRPPSANKRPCVERSWKIPDTIHGHAYIG